MPNMMKAYIYEPMNDQIMLDGPPRRGPSIAPNGAKVQSANQAMPVCTSIRREKYMGKRNGKALRHRNKGGRGSEAARQRGIERGKATERHLLIRSRTSTQQVQRC